MSSFNSHFPNKKKIDLTDISNRKEEVLVEIRKQQDLIVDHAKVIFQPVNSVFNVTQTYAKPFQLGLGTYSALRLGWQLFRGIKGVGAIGAVQLAWQLIKKGRKVLKRIF
ncbi:MAG: hypothetical protein GX963_09280 [Bacteroidales bacterium]|nr:hypothetical protein [Bacteroidales bacterium]